MVHLQRKVEVQCFDKRLLFSGVTACNLIFHPKEAIELTATAAVF